MKPKNRLFKNQKQVIKQASVLDFQSDLLAWFNQQGRKDLPWQLNKTPYRVWVSEIMLQQTQVSTVISYYLRFMERFPNIETLACATEDEVLCLWTGLGYYTRARNLHRTAKLIVEYHQGHFPSTLVELEALPGIGRSTAGAILALAFEKLGVILDGNVKRVLTRWQGIKEWPGEKEVMAQLWELAHLLTPIHKIADYTQAIMDLGATVCTRGKPSCEKCPLETNCVAHIQGIEKKLPKSKPKKILPVRQATFLIVQKNQTVLLEKRQSTGVWAGLWSLPEISGQPTFDEIHKICKLRFRMKISAIKNLENFRHTFSHFHLDISPVIVTLKTHQLKMMEASQQIWYNLQHPTAVGLPAPVKHLLKHLE